ncbi:MAG TPA: FG-GAP-like repeat-containing protein [Candidatus Solibacter sp.]|nr:FG-GAP-like repeat-containing protein [Candidatus Solibacter sp.]
MKSFWLVAVIVVVSSCAFGQSGRVGSIPGARTSVAFAPDPAVPATGFGSVAADFNGDGKIDIATTNAKAGGLTIRLGKGDGTFLPAVTYRAGYYYNAVVVGDFNGDGKLDVAASLPFLCGGCGGYGSYLLQVFLGAGDGSFKVLVPKTVFYGEPLAVGDFNGDGKLDVLVGNTDYYGEDWFVSVALGNGDGTFTKGAYLGDAIWFTTPAVGDVNGDGKLDVVLPALDGTEGNLITYVFMGNGDGSFQTPATYSSSQNLATRAVVADFNGDGKLDIATDAVQVLMNNGDGTFTDAGVDVRGIAGNGTFGGIVAGDFNDDGKVDFAASVSVNAAPGGNVFLSNGDGTFKIVDVPAAGILQAANFNNDGKLDLLTSGGVFLQTPASLLPPFLGFGEIPVNTQTSAQTLTLTNVGNVSMKINNVQLTGTGASQYRQSNNCGTALGAGKTCQIQVVFAPTVPGTANAAVSVSVPGAPASVSTLLGSAR